MGVNDTNPGYNQWNPAYILNLIMKIARYFEKYRYIQYTYFSPKSKVAPYGDRHKT